MGACENFFLDGSNFGDLIRKRRMLDESEGGLDSGVCEKLDIAGGVCDKLDFETSNAGNLNGRNGEIKEIENEIDQLLREVWPMVVEYIRTDMRKAKVQP